MKGSCLRASPLIADSLEAATTAEAAVRHAVRHEEALYPCLSMIVRSPVVHDPERRDLQAMLAREVRLELTPEAPAGHAWLPAEARAGRSWSPEARAGCAAHHVLPRSRRERGRVRPLRRAGRPAASREAVFRRRHKKKPSISSVGKIRTAAATAG